MSVLIVDDSKFNQALIKLPLEEAHEDILTASSAEEAYKVLEEYYSIIDLIIMDIVMPRISGIEACRTIKSNPLFRDIPIIMVTARTDISDLQEAFEAGAIDFIAKPFEKIELLARTRSALMLKEEMDRRKCREQELIKVTKQLEKANEELQRLSMLDGLTGIYNRRSFDEFISLEWRRSIREKNCLSLLLIDVDDFKKFNDHYGHQAGDDCLKKVAATLKATVLRAGDVVARYGGEEFVVILPNTQLNGAEHIAQHILQNIWALEIKHEYSSASKNLTVSIGVAASCSPPAHVTADVLILAADEALYEAKRRGSNQFQCKQVQYDEPFS